MIQTILFDLDGTIIDTEPAALEAILTCAGDWGLKVQHKDAASVAGKKWEIAFDHLYSLYSFPLPKEEASRIIIQRYQGLVRAKPRIVPGVVEAIHDFAKNYSMALVSGSHREDVHWALHFLGVQNLFKEILGAEDYSLSKPSPEGFQKAMGLLDAKPQETLVFEDSAPGIASALAAGAWVTAIESTNHFKHSQKEAHARILDFHGIDSRWVKNRFV